ncbi:MAG TPA: pyridoxal phosphate-dependent aminotransferase [Deltaproteobacteria bacterium]|nr:pyridoxal phosphate-dependent aminotransferase [Deltaproteobacteria bacterium]
MNFLAKRVDNLEESATLAVTARAKALRAEGRDILSFAAGEPDFDTPDNIKLAAVKALREGHTKYTPVGGIPELKDAIIEKFKRDNGLDYERDEILVSCGAKHSFYNLCNVILDPGDEVLIPSPYWTSYPEIVKIAGGDPEIMPTSEKEDYKLNPGLFNEYITSRTKALVLNSPSNPTGTVYTADELAEIAQVALRKDVLIISDEIYEKLVYDSLKAVSIASLADELRDRVVIINGLSKTYAMTGWRIGYTAGPKEIIKAMTVLQSQSTSNPASMSQWGAVEALTGPQDEVEKRVGEFEKRRNAMVEGLEAIKDVTVVRPGGAFYVFANLSRYYWREYGGKTIKGSVDMAAYLLEEAGVAVVPGEAFGEDTSVRITFASSLEDIQEGLRRMGEALARL